MKQEKKAKIHVVDDDLAMRFALDSILRSVGYDVALYENGLELLDQAKKGIAGCIVLDVRLPGPGGLEVQRRLNEMGCNIPVIFLTGHGDVAMAVKAMKANAIEFMTKPFREQDLLDAISCAMEAATQHEQAFALQEKMMRQMNMLSARSFLNAVRFMVAGEQYLPPQGLRGGGHAAPASALSSALTDRESQVLRGLCDSLSNKEIARRLEISEPTVKVHAQSVFRKIGARNRTHAALIARQQGFS